MFNVSYTVLIVTQNIVYKKNNWDLVYFCLLQIYERSSIKCCRRQQNSEKYTSGLLSKGPLIIL